MSVPQPEKHRISILPSPKYGLPITQDQDYWLALMKLTSEARATRRQTHKSLHFYNCANPEILGHQTHNGKNYKAVEEGCPSWNRRPLKEGPIMPHVRAGLKTEPTPLTVTRCSSSLYHVWVKPLEAGNGVRKLLIERNLFYGGITLGPSPIMPSRGANLKPLKPHEQQI